MADNRTLEEVVAPVKDWLGPRGGRKRVELLCNGPLAAAAKTALAGALVVHVPALQAACELLLAMVILLGATNVGKSTLCNAFVGSVVLPAVPQSESAVPTAVEHVERAGPPVLTGLQGGTRVELERGDGPIYKRLKKMSEDAREDRTGAKAREMREMELRVEASIGFAARGSAAASGGRAGHLARETAGAGARSDFVVFVLSYTDLANAEAFRRLGDLLRERPDLTDRIVVVVNKIDQHRPAEEGALKPADVPARVVRMLRTETGVEVPEGAVVCVAGRKALLARRFLAGEATADEKDELFRKKFGFQWQTLDAANLRDYAEQAVDESGLPALEARLVATVVQNRALLLDAAAGRLRSGLTPLAEGVKALFDAVSARRRRRRRPPARRSGPWPSCAAARPRPPAPPPPPGTPGGRAAALLGWELVQSLGQAARHVDLVGPLRQHAAAIADAAGALLSGVPAQRRNARSALLAAPFGSAEVVADFDAAEAAVDSQLDELRARAETPGRPAPTADEAERAARAAGEAAARFAQGAAARLLCRASARLGDLLGSSARAALLKDVPHVAEAAAAAVTAAAARAAEANARRWLAERGVAPASGAGAVRATSRQETVVVQRPETVPVPHHEEITEEVPVVHEEQVQVVEQRATIVKQKVQEQEPIVEGRCFVVGGRRFGLFGPKPKEWRNVVVGYRTVEREIDVPTVENVTVTKTVPRVRTEERTRTVVVVREEQRMRDAAETATVEGHVVDGAALAAAMRPSIQAVCDAILAEASDLFSSAAVAAAARREAAAAALPACAPPARRRRGGGAAREALAGARREQSAAEAELVALRGLLAALPRPAPASPPPSPPPAPERRPPPPSPLPFPPVVFPCESRQALSAARRGGLFRIRRPRFERSSQSL
eukprot:tig00020816_g14163.t1